MDDADRSEQRERKIQVHIAAGFALRLPEQMIYRQCCTKCGRSLRSWSQENFSLWKFKSDEVEQYGLPAGTLLAITRDSQYITGPTLGINEEFCS